MRRFTVVSVFIGAFEAYARVNFAKRPGKTYFLEFNVRGKDSTCFFFFYFVLLGIVDPTRSRHIRSGLNRTARN